MRKKSNPEYQGGYVPIHEAVLLEIISQYRNQKAGFKVLARVFAAMTEKTALRTESKVDLYRIVNCKATENGCRRLSQAQIEKAVQKVGEITNSAMKRTVRRKRPVARKLLRAIAQGRLSPSECIVLLYYSSRRITQEKSMYRLNREERYGRFKYGELQELAGIEKARVGDAVASLREKGLLHVVEVHQKNVNAYGLCFVDGWLISLFRTMGECVGKVVKEVVSVAKKTATPYREKSNTPHAKTAGLIKKNPKTSKKEKKDFHFEKRETKDELFARLRKKCELILSETIPQTA